VICTGQGSVLQAQGTGRWTQQTACLSWMAGHAEACPRHWWPCVDLFTHKKKISMLYRGEE
jgi:hypothetical protein